jgi:hypothetical protein
MAVGAAHLTLLDLPVDPGQTRIAVHQPRHVVGLLADVIEVENAGIRLSAVHARAPGQDRPDVGSISAS